MSSRQPPGNAFTEVGPEIPDRAGNLRSEGHGPMADAATRVSASRSAPSHTGTHARSPAHTERLLRITAAIANAVSSPEVFRALVDDVADAIHASSAGLWLLDEDGATARLMRSRGYSPSSEKSLETLPLAGSPPLPILDCIRSGDPVWFASQAALLERYPHLGAITTSGRHYRVSALPLLSNGRVLGALGITIDETVPVAEEERDFLRLVALYASQAVERLRLLEAERRSREEAHVAAHRLALLNRLSRAFSETDLDLETRLRAIATELGKTLDAAIAVGLLGPDDMLHTAAVHHPDPEGERELERFTAARPVSRGEGIGGTVLETGRSVRLSPLDPADARTRMASAFRDYFERFPTYALICSPLRTRGRVIGVVSATRVRPGQTFDEDDVRVIEELAERAAVEIDNAGLYRETREARLRAEQLYRFAQAVVAADRVETVFDSALDAIQNALGTRRSAILTCDDEGILRFRAWRHLSDEYRRAVEGHSPWSPDDPAPRPVLVPDAMGDPSLAGYRSLFESEGIGALAFIPLVSRSRLLGKFMVYHERARVFAPHEIETAQAIANHLGSVMTRFAAITRLEETIRSNELFAGALAHDLRNPLGAIMTAAQVALMQREGEDPRGARDPRPLSRILSSGHRMANMIDQLLDFTRARSGGGIPIDPHETNLADLCAQAIGELELGHPEWSVERRASGDLSGTWDSDRLLQVISNLVANAGQHGTPQAPIRVHVDGTAAGTVAIEIHNQGAIPPGLLAHLFDPFRGTRYRRDQSQGLGLGLYIVREIVRAHGGSVSLRSNEAEGTTFRIELPRASARRRGTADGHAGGTQL